MTFDALAVVHDCGLLNGDIRCPNVLVDNRAHQGVRLMDFGFSRPSTSSEDHKRESVRNWKSCWNMCRNLAS